MKGSDTVIARAHQGGLTLTPRRGVNSLHMHHASEARDRNPPTNHLPAHGTLLCSDIRCVLQLYTPKATKVSMIQSSVEPASPHSP